MNIGVEVFRALYRARLGILTIALTYGIFVVVGMVMVGTGNEFALSYRDRLVSRARANDPSLIALDRGDRLTASLWDFGRNLLGAAADTVGGMGVIFPYPAAAYRGWVGGVVSVDSAHVSRLSNPAEAAYYLTTLILQLIPYSLAGGVGVNLGIAYFRPGSFYQGEKWHGLPKEAIKDVLRVYLLIIPLFFAASLWEFFLR